MKRFSDCIATMSADSVHEKSDKTRGSDQDKLLEKIRDPPKGDDGQGPSQRDAENE